MAHRLDERHWVSSPHLSSLWVGREAMMGSKWLEMERDTGEAPCPYVRSSGSDASPS